MQVYRAGDPQHGGQVGHGALGLHDLTVQLADELTGRHLLAAGQVVEDLPEFVFQPHAGHAALQA